VADRRYKASKASYILATSFLPLRRSRDSQVRLQRGLRRLSRAVAVRDLKQLGQFAVAIALEIYLNPGAIEHADPSQVGHASSAKEPLIFSPISGPGRSESGSRVAFT
jgi:hypothetical protein